MYTRSHGRFPRGMRVPENYSGNAFRVEPVESSVEDMSQNENGVTAREQENAEAKRKEEDTPAGLSLPRPRLFSGGLLSRLTGGGGIGLEELLLVGLILLLSEDGGNDDLVLLLILLLLVS